MNQTLALYQKMGPQAFSKAATELAPYFATIEPEFVELRPGYAEVRFANRREVHNHIAPCMRLHCAMRRNWRPAA
jgi:acyl-coenzyme A thioesterase PaaI-like protein